MVHVLARITALPASADTMREILVELAAQTRKEAGCLHYALFQQDGAAHIFQTVERWADGAAVDAHMAERPLRQKARGTWRRNHKTRRADL